MIANIANLDRTTFEHAKSLIARTNLTSVRFVKFSMVLGQDSGDNLEEPIDVSSSAKSSGIGVEGGIVLYFDMKILGNRRNGKVFEIAAKLEARYDVAGGETPIPMQIKAFARSNGMLNIWPYWREFVQSATQRAGFAPLTLPLFRVVYGTPAKRKK